MPIRAGRAAVTLAALLLGALLVPPSLAAQRGVRGTFVLHTTAGGDSVSFELGTRTGNVERRITRVAVASAEVRGLTPAQLEASNPSAVHLMVVRESGTFVFRGTLDRDGGAGSFDFVGDNFFANAVARRVFTRPSDEELMRIAAAGLSTALVDGLRALGYARPTLREVIRLGEHRVTVQFAQGLADAGAHLHRVSDLIAFRDHGVSPEYVADLRRAGYGDLAPAEMLRMKDRDVDAAFIAQLAAVGYTGLSADEAILAREHRVDSAFAQEFRREGFLDLSLTDLMALRDHEVSPGFARELKARARTQPSADELVRARLRAEG